MLRKTIELSPDSVTIYEMEIPFNTTIYQADEGGGKTGRARGGLGHETALG